MVEEGRKEEGMGQVMDGWEGKAGDMKPIEGGKKKVHQTD